MSINRQHARNKRLFGVFTLISKDIQAKNKNNLCCVFLFPYCFCMRLLRFPCLI